MPLSLVQRGISYMCLCCRGRVRGNFKIGLVAAALGKLYRDKNPLVAAAVKRQPLQVRRISAIQYEGITGG